MQPKALTLVNQHAPFSALTFRRDARNWRRTLQPVTGHSTVMTSSWLQSLGSRRGRSASPHEFSPADHYFTPGPVDTGRFLTKVVPPLA